MNGWNDFWNKVFMALSVPGFSFGTPHPYVLNIASNKAAFAKVGSLLNAALERKNTAA